MIVLFFGDLHLADRPPAGRVDDYAQAVLTKLERIAELCTQRHAAYAFGTGDIFHVKQPNRVSHALVQQTIAVFKSFPCPVFVIPGNHDLGPDGLDSLSRQPLGVLEKAGAVSILRGVTWFEDKNSGLWVVPRPYSAVAEGVLDGQVDPTYYTLSKEEEQALEQHPGPVVGLAHGSILPPGDSRQYPHLTVDQIPEWHCYDLLVSGHLHEALGVVQMGEPSSGKRTLFTNPGSIGRTRRDLPSYSRQVGVLSVEASADGLEVTELPLPGVSPATEVFGGRPVEEAQEAPNDEITHFVDALGEGLRADELSLEELLSSLGEIEPEVKVELRRLLEEEVT